MLSTTRKAAVIAVFIFVAGFASAALAQPAPEFSLRSIDGEAVTSQNLRGEVAVLAFGASWLPLSRNQMESVKKLADQYAGKGVAVYWVSVDSENPKSKNYVSDDQLRDLARKYKVTILRDSDGALSRKMGIDQLPSVVILDKQGNISSALGGMDPNANLTTQLAARLNKIL
ncbi:MAG TPA: TlpA disulfide reductase family protein [Pyrinomonadaceae bacterium]|nr:TlpA disulfide reductase family protein [Pyrinomonadaceae bacterium]